MSLAVYMDVHVPAAVTEGLRRTPQGTPIGRMIEDSELCLAGMTADEFRNRLVHLPLRQPLDDVEDDDPTVTMREYKPQMVTRFTINAVPALVMLERGKPTDRDGAPVPVWDSIHASPIAEPAPTAGPAKVIVPPIYDRRAAARKPRKTKRHG